MATKISLSRTSKANLLAALAAITIAGCGAEAPAADTAARALMYNGHDYLFIRSAKTWAQAKASCEELGYGLVTVNDANEENWLGSFEGPSAWWIGYTDQQVEGSWQWSTGTSSYSNWNPWQPDNGSGVEDCAEDNYDGTGRWNDLPCSASLYYICESLL